jgi:hypothetical protein
LALVKNSSLVHFPPDPATEVSRLVEVVASRGRSKVFYFQALEEFVCLRYVLQYHEIEAVEVPFMGNHFMEVVFYSDVKVRVVFLARDE